ncbi:tripartite tricarboxylate transporter substrate binding protein [Cupriavidus oxalaticus]|uniref:Extra-cytoplasmic solute receptor family protein 90 n=1 Tax=Cupriavidus oxalaticus TaxID=96344 RepID=A0A976GDK2_9BURK|nr:tripartite tricarboxylate transporter substrate binding protein [Cupriavidus oxalaticus]QRQ85119.1 tripartite tricarboxylate transporter substrate binding protein [Cupriavidus oxalaticus]QRQ90793.1 tripartite tricarboxylate transporter substrate binding protein [Cupriavidus oxalaticus]WQD85319.1 tripartite tricarboxylate transporter substrate binding protein [Cupriavidus oxalaticus]SPC23305.1 Extra-cytoplasmic solute receptor family protein 90 [Cupriavidus oxalaticus]
MKRRHLILAFAAMHLTAGVALAQAPDAWPGKPIRIIHGFAAGGPIDSFARLLAAQFHERFGQPAIVEAKPGAGGTIAARYVARSAPDGYTLYLMASGHATAPGLYKSLGYDPVKDFAVISMVARSPYAIVANPKAGFDTVGQLFSAARQQPGKVDYGSGGNGTGMHLAAAVLQARTGVRLSHVAYKGGSATALAVVGGEVPVIFTSLAGMSPYIDSGKVKVLAVTTRERFRLYPNVPTIAETVLPGFDVTAWYAFAGPKGLRADVMAKLGEMVRVTLQRADVAESLRMQAAEPWHTSHDTAQRFVAEEVSQWRKVIQDEKLSEMN